MMSKAIEVDSASKVHLEWNEFVRLIIPNRQSEWNSIENFKVMETLIKTFSQKEAYAQKLRSSFSTFGSSQDQC